MAVDARKLLARYRMLKEERQSWDGAWRELTELFLPTRWQAEDETSYSAGGSSGGYGTDKPYLNDRLVNSAGVLAMRTMAAGLQGGMTSPVRPWFRLKLREGGVVEGAPENVAGGVAADPGGAGLPGPSGVAGGPAGAGVSGGPDSLNAWLDEATRAMQSVLHSSNAYTALHGLYADLGTFGTALLVETADADGLHFHLVRAGEYVLDVDSKGNVDTFYRRMNMTARQIVDMWGSCGTVPEAVRRAAESAAGSTRRYSVIHAVFPREDWQGDRPLCLEGKPFASVYFMESVRAGVGGDSGSGSASSGSCFGGPAILSEGGYDMFPGFAPRWDVAAGEVYGRSPAMDVAADCKMLQAMTVTLRRMQHKMADPPMLADAGLRKFGVSLDPGTVNFVDMNAVMQSGAPIAPVQMPEPQALNFTMQGIQSVEKTVQGGLYCDLFRMLIDDDRRQITAFEVQARQQEKLSLIGPVVERLIKELLEPVIQRTFSLMREWGALPPLPPGVSFAELDVDFESVLAQAQHRMATSTMDQGLAFIMQAAQAMPQILDIVDCDAMGRAYLDRLGVPPSCLRDSAAIENIRRQREAANILKEDILSGNIPPATILGEAVNG